MLVPLRLGRVLGFRGTLGEMTVRVASGDATRWVGLKNVLLADPADPGGARKYQVERARGYRDRLVLKLRGVDDAGTAGALRGRWILAPGEEVPELPSGVHFVERIVGLRVIDERGASLGKVADVEATGGTDLLVLEGNDGEEILVPLASEFVASIDTTEGLVRVRLPEGLVDLNRKGGGRS